MKSFINYSGMRSVLMLLAGLLLVGTVSCGGGGGGIHESDGAGGKKKDPAVPSVAIVYRNGYQITVQGKDAQAVEIEFTSGLHEVYMLSKQGTCFSASRDGIDNIKVMSKGGDYWYFDSAGVLIPDFDDDRGTSGLLSGTLGLVTRILKPKPVIKVSCTGGPYDDKTASAAGVGNGNGIGNAKHASSLLNTVVNVSSNLLYTQVKVATSTNVVQTYTDSTYSGSYDTQTTVSVDAVKVTLADGSKWYFDAAGNILPQDSKWYTDLD
jgi:hypothetical protein